MNEFSTYEDFLRYRGVTLNIPGVDELALSYDDALQATLLLKAELIPVLGGDVYFLLGNKAEPAYANWYTNQQPGESAADYCRRSCDATTEYIENFPRQDGRNAIYVLVIGSKS